MAGVVTLQVACGGPPPPDPVPSPPETVVLEPIQVPPPEARPDTAGAEPAVEPAPERDPEPEPEPRPETVDPAVPGARAMALLESLTLREKAGQMIMPIVLGTYAAKGSPAHDRPERWVEELGIGGVIMSVGTPPGVAVKLNDLQGHARIPLLVGADLETGAGFRLRGAVHLPAAIALGGATDFPSLMAVGATWEPGLAYRMGEITAREARAVGIHVPFAPVLDVNSNPDNPIINTRSFGEDPEMVAILGSAFVRGVQEHGAIATGKHFPGHGDTDTDSHLGLPVIQADRARLDSLELHPFQAAIEAGMGAVMTAHITVPALNGGTRLPATLSGPVLTGLLREEMGFDGLVFTDAMDMGAIDREWGRREATMRAVEAGADMILMPPDPEAALEAIEAGVRSGRIPEARVDSAVARILRAKESLGLLDDRYVEPGEVVEVVGIPEHEEVAEEIARRSMTLLRNGGDLLPLLGTRSARVLSVTYRRRNDLLAGRAFDARLRATYPRLTTVEVGRDSGVGIYDGILRQAGRSQLVVVSLYVTAVSYSGSVAVPEEMADFIQELARRNIPHVVISFGNPYLLREFPDARAYMLAWSGADVSQRAAADALFGRFAITGRTPTRLPPFFEIGDGIRLPARGVADAR